MGLNPHVVGRFFRVHMELTKKAVRRLNPHVVGRFFRAQMRGTYLTRTYVLIPMWWGGFSEVVSSSLSKSQMRLNPHVVGRFFRGESNLKERTKAES